MRECSWSKLHDLRAKELQTRSTVLLEVQVRGPQPQGQVENEEVCELRRECPSVSAMFQAGRCVWSSPCDH